jgi:sugar phosphate permease
VFFVAILFFAAGGPAMSVVARPTRVRWLIFGLACAVSWLLYLHRYAWGVVRPSLKAEHPELTDVQLGWLDALFNVGYAAGQVPGGLLGDVLGARGVLAALIVGWSGCVAWLAVAGGFAGLAAFRVCFGLSQAGAYPILSQVTRRWFPPATRTTVQGAVASLAGRAGGACAPLLVAAALMGALGLSWREALVGLSLLGVVLAVAFAGLFRNRPGEHPWTNAAEQQLIGDDAPASGPAARPRLRLDRRATWTLAALLVYSFASTFADQLYVFWIPLFLIEGKGLSQAEMGLFAGLPLVGGAVGGLVGGALNDLLIRWTGSRRLGRGAVAFAGKFLAAGLITASLAVEDGRLVMVVLLLCKFFGDWSLASLWGTITDVGGPASGTVFGVVNTMGSVAAFLAGPGMGYLKHYTGWQGLFGCVAGVYFASALCWFVIDCTCRMWGEQADSA